MDTYRGSCHCGAVAFVVEHRLDRVSQCNCSICTKKAYLHWIVPRPAFRLLTSRDHLSTYTFNTGVAQHYFCRTCGVAPFYIPRSDPDRVDINVRCIDGIEMSQLTITQFDGQNWEEAYRRERGAGS